MSTLLLINPNTTASITALVLKHAEGFANKGTAVRAVTSAFGPRYIASRIGYAIAGHAAVDALANDTARKESMDLSKYAGRQVYLEVIDGGTGKGYAWIAVGRFDPPVIAVPMATTVLSGIDALLSSVQMPAGVPVAAMAIDKPGAANAAIYAAEIIGTSAAIAEGATGNAPP